MEQFNAVLLLKHVRVRLHSLLIRVKVSKFTATAALVGAKLIEIPQAILSTCCVILSGHDCHSGLVHLVGRRRRRVRGRGWRHTVTTDGITGTHLVRLDRATVSYTHRGRNHLMLGVEDRLCVPSSGCHLPRPRSLKQIVKLLVSDVGRLGHINHPLVQPVYRGGKAPVN